MCQRPSEVVKELLNQLVIVRGDPRFTPAMSHSYVHGGSFLHLRGLCSLTRTKVLRDTLANATEQRTVDDSEIHPLRLSAVS